MPEKVINILLVEDNKVEVLDLPKFVENVATLNKYLGIIEHILVNQVTDFRYPKILYSFLSWIIRKEKSYISTYVWRRK